MNLEDLRRLFCAKITLEYESIHEEMLSKEKEEIYDNAFYIDAVISIYECLLEMSQEMEQEGLKFSLFQMDEKRRFLCGGIGRLCKRGNYKDEICRGKCEREMMHV